MRNGLRLLPAFVCLLVAGCSTPDVNPQSPRANTGYVDFYTDSNLALSWKVKRADAQGGELRPVFSEFTPVQGNILRLAAAPGRYRYEVWFSNEVTTGAQTVLVQVAGGQITPVHVTLTPAGSTSVESKSYEYRPTARATRRVTRISSGQEEVFQISAVAEGPQPYQTKDRMPYYSPSTK